MRRIADMGVRYSNFHTTALCSPTRSSLLTGRNATSNGMATIAEFSSGFPGHLDPDPVRERLHLRGAGRARLQHLLRRQVAPDAGRGVQPGRVQGPLAARPRVRALLRLPRRRVEQWYPDLVHDNHQIDPPATPEEGYHLVEGPRRPGDRVHPRRQGHRPRQAVLHVPRPAGRARAAPRAQGVGRQVQGQVRPGLRGDPRRDPRPPEGARPAARRHRAVGRSTRTASPSAPGPTASPGRCSTRCGRGTR